MNGTEFSRISGSYSTAYIGTYEVLSQSTSNNSTTFRLYGYFYYGGGTSVGSSSSSFVLDGTTIKTGSYRYYPGYTLLGTKDITVTHNNDGSFPGRSVTISASSYHISGSASGNLSANKIDRQATVTSATDFTDEGNPTIKYTNPGGFRINARLEFAGSIIRRDNISNTGSYTFDLTDDERKLLRQKCTSNSMIVREVIATCISGDTESFWSCQDKTMTIVNANPTFSNFNFEDINSITVALTGNNQNVIKGYSNVKVTIPVVNKAEALKEATMKKYRFTCGDISTLDISYSDSEEVNGTISAVPNGTFTAYATDSRNNSTSVQKLANQVIDYTPLIKGNISIGRNNGVSESVTLSFNGTIDVRNFGKVTNSIKSAKFRFKVANSSDDWTERELTVNVSGSSFSFNGLVEGDTETKGFNVSNSYQIEVIVKDELSIITFTDKFGSGTPNLAFHKNGIGIMGKYDEKIGGKGQIAGSPLAYYPIGAIYISVSETSPDELFGGTWEQIQGRFLLSSGNNGDDLIRKLNTTGGEAIHKLTVNEMPSHTHAIQFDQTQGNNNGGLKVGVQTIYTGTYDFVKETGGNQAHNNMPPYLVVNMWKRIA